MEVTLISMSRSSRVSRFATDSHTSFLVLIFYIPFNDYGFCQRCRPPLSPSRAFSWPYVYNACSGPLAEECERGQWFVLFLRFAAFFFQ